MKWINANTTKPKLIDGLQISKHLLCQNKNEGCFVAFYDYVNNEWQLAHGKIIEIMKVDYYMELPIQPN